MARKAAAAFVQHGGDAAREAVGAALPNPTWQTNLRSSLKSLQDRLPGYRTEYDETADEIDKVTIEVPSNAACTQAGTGFTIGVWMHIPFSKREWDIVREVERRDQ